jgi:hypothetical protein
VLSLHEGGSRWLAKFCALSETGLWTKKERKKENKKRIISAEYNFSQKLARVIFIATADVNSP